MGEGGLSFFAPVAVYVSTASGTETHPSSEHLGSLALCFRTSASNAAAPTDIYACLRENGDRQRGCYGHIEGCMPSSVPIQCKYASWSSMAVIRCKTTHCLSPPSAPGGHDYRIPALDLSGDCDERPHLPLACKWRRDCPASQVLYLDIKSRRFLLQCPPLTTILQLSVARWGSSWRSSPLASMTNSQDEACRADVDKRHALSAVSDAS